MKRLTIVFTCAILLISGFSKAYSKQRIGVYDSRIIAIWYFQGGDGEFTKIMKEFMASMKKAQDNKDTIEVKKLSEKAQISQRIAHDKGFGRGSVAEIVQNKQEEFRSLAKNENLIAIVSKWEVNYSTQDVELVDVTLKLLELFKANDNIKKMIDEMKSIEPIKDAFFIED